MPGRIDAHTHLFPRSQALDRSEIAACDPSFAAIYRDPNAKLAQAEDLLKELLGGGITKAVAVGFAFSRERSIDEQNEYLLGEAASTGKGRIIPFATLNPAHGGWEKVAERALGAGARGFGELRPENQGWDPLGEEAAKLCELAGEAGRPLLWHVSEPIGHRYPGKEGGIDPVDLARLAQRFPQTKMIAAHMGGGLSFYLQMPEIREALSNVYFDTAAWTLLYDERSITHLVALAGAGRVLFASDYPLLSPRRQLERILPLIPPEAAEAVCGRNAEILLAD